MHCSAVLLQTDSAVTFTQGVSNSQEGTKSTGELKDTKAFSREPPCPVGNMELPALIKHSTKARTCMQTPAPPDSNLSPYFGYFWLFLGSVLLNPLCHQQNYQVQHCTRRLPSSSAPSPESPQSLYTFKTNCKT